MIKVLVVSPYGGNIGLAQFYCRAFKTIGCDVQRFNLMEEVPWINLAVRMKQHAKKRVGWVRALARRTSNRALLERIEEVRPDLILIVQGDDIYPETLKRIKDTVKGKLLLYYSDNPWVSAGKESCFWDAAQLYDCVFTFNRCLIPHIYHIGAQRVIYLPFAYDPETHAKIEDVNLVPAVYGRHNISYIGSWSSSYEQWLAPLIPYGLAIWGLGWEKADARIRGCWQRENGRPLGHGAGIRYVCAVSKIIVNFMRPQHVSSHSMKTYEIPAAGGLMLTTRTKEQIEVFAEDVSASYFLTRGEMEAKICSLLSDEAKREIIRRQGYHRATSETYAVRAKEMLGVFNQLSRY